MAVAFEEFVNLVLTIVAAEHVKEGLEAGRLQVQSSLSPVVNTAGAAGKMSNRALGLGGSAVSKNQARKLENMHSQPLIHL